MKIKITRNKIIAFAAIIALLAAAFWYGGNAPGLQGWNVSSDSEDGGDAAVVSENAGLTDEEETEKHKQEKNDDSDDSINNENEEKSDKADTTAEEENGAETDSPEKRGIETRPGGAEAGLSADEKVNLAKEISDAEGSSPGMVKGSKEYSQSEGMSINEETGKDKYLTDPVPEGKPLPVEPQDIEISDTEYKCTLSVRCDTILDNIDWLDPEKAELVPEDGVIFPSTEVTFYEGESVLNVLQREMKKAKIHMGFENTPMYNSAYIEGINNLYEFDCGELSGWMYKVNGWFPNYGCSRYQLKDGDTVEWVFTCDLGVDVDGYYSSTGQ